MLRRCRARAASAAGCVVRSFLGRSFLVRCCRLASRPGKRLPGPPTRFQRTLINLYFRHVHTIANENPVNGTPATGPSVGADAFLTLHYRLTLVPSEVDLVDTFNGKPATLQLGIGQLAEPLEQHLQGLHEGDERVFDLAAGEAYGARQPSLVIRLSRAALAQATPQAVDSLAIGDPLEILSPDGKRVVGKVMEVDSDALTLDFNHPLAGQAMRFTVRLIGIL